MTRVNVRKAFVTAALSAAAGMAIVGVSAAHPGAYGMGYGMMGGDGSGYHMGPAMMGGYGPGHGMGPGMMYGSGPGYGMGPEMMYGYGPGAGECHTAYGADLSAEQQSKLAAIQDELAHKQIDRMSAIRGEQFKLRELYSAPQRDDKAIGASRERLGKLQREMHQAGLDARKQMDSVLTPEQREQMRAARFGARTR